MEAVTIKWKPSCPLRALFSPQPQKTEATHSPMTHVLQRPVGDEGSALCGHVQTIVLLPLGNTSLRQLSSSCYNHYPSLLLSSAALPITQCMEFLGPWRPTPCHSLVLGRFSASSSRSASKAFTTLNPMAHSHRSDCCLWCSQEVEQWGEINCVYMCMCVYLHMCIYTYTHMFTIHFTT